MMMISDDDDDDDDDDEEEDYSDNESVITDLLIRLMIFTVIIFHNCHQRHQHRYHHNYPYNCYIQLSIST